ncbi:MAG TPA: hypothetical protein VH499_22365 [Reyranella sp.]
MSSFGLSEEFAATDAKALATRLCLELLALTAETDSNVHCEVLRKRLKAGMLQLDEALAFAAARGWISRTADMAALRGPGRERALRLRPTLETLRRDLSNLRRS